MPKQAKSEQEILEEVYNRASALYQSGKSPPRLKDPFAGHCQKIIESQEGNRGVLAVLITLLVKKLHEPKQDIRKHQTQLTGGFSGRVLDTRVVTPFLRQHHFPFMQGGSGWLTRSLEQAQPYDLNYPGKITPANVKIAFLQLVDGVQVKGLSSRNLLLNLFAGLIRHRDQNTNLVLARPVNLSIADTVARINQHHRSLLQGASRLPVLAIHAVLSILVKETERYRNCTLLPLEHHTAADSRTDLIGDAHIVDENNVLFEGYEVKHNIPITSELINASFEKLKTTPVKRFYILTTYQHDSYVEFAQDIQNVAQGHGCQLILNGVNPTLTYYLRLLNDTSRFVDGYVSNLEKDPSVTYQLKQAWNEIVQA